MMSNSQPLYTKKQMAEKSGCSLKAIEHRLKYRKIKPEAYGSSDDKRNIVALFSQDIYNEICGIRNKTGYGQLSVVTEPEIKVAAEDKSVLTFSSITEADTLKIFRLKKLKDGTINIRVGAESDRAYYTLNQIEKEKLLEFLQQDEK